MRKIFFPFVVVLLVLYSCGVHTYYIYESDLPQDNYNKSVIYQDSAITCYFSSHTWVESDGQLLNDSFNFTLFFVARPDTTIEIEDLITTINVKVSNKEIPFNTPFKIEYFSSKKGDDYNILRDTVEEYSRFKNEYKIVRDSSYISYFDFNYLQPRNIENFYDIDKIIISIKFRIKNKDTNVNVLIKKQTFHDVISPLNH